MIYSVVRTFMAEQIANLEASSPEEAMQIFKSMDMDDPRLGEIETEPVSIDVYDPTVEDGEPLINEEL